MDPHARAGSHEALHGARVHAVRGDEATVGERHVGEEPVVPTQEHSLDERAGPREREECAGFVGHEPRG